MTDCPNAEMRDRLPELANDSLSPELRVVVMTHVAECVDCAAEIEILRVARLVVVESTPSVNVARVVSALPRRRELVVSRGRSWASWRVAAAVTVLVAGGGSLTLMHRSPGIAPDTTVSTSVAESSAGLALTGSLADMSEAELEALVDGLGAIEALPAREVEGEVTTLSVPGGTGVPDSVLRDLEGV